MVINSLKMKLLQRLRLIAPVKFSLKKMVYGITRKQLILLMISVILLHVH